MKCTFCSNKAVYAGQGQLFCRSHFLDYVETKVLRTIKKYTLIEKGDVVAVAASGGKDSLCVLYMTMKFCREYNVPFFALAVDEGIAGYRDHTLKDLRLFCRRYKTKLHTISFKKEFGITLDEAKDKAMKELNKKPCTVCGVFRRTALNRAARKLKATTLVTGHNLDDEAQSFMMNALKGNMGHNAALGPVTGLEENEKFVPRVKPLYFITEKESRLYAFLKKFKVDFVECPNTHLSFRQDIRDMLNEFEAKFPGAKNGIVNSFMEILPELKKKYKHRRDFTYCERCGDACSGRICNACLLVERLCAKKKILRKK